MMFNKNGTKEFNKMCRVQIETQSPWLGIEVRLLIFYIFVSKILEDGEDTKPCTRVFQDVRKDWEVLTS